VRFDGGKHILLIAPAKALKEKLLTELRNRKRWMPITFAVPMAWHRTRRKPPPLITLGVTKRCG
jgi:hypothetical protein